MGSGKDGGLIIKLCKAIYSMSVTIYFSLYPTVSIGNER